MAEYAGKVYLVGSGPGDAAYLTLQAHEILAQAEVLVYDALVDGDLIDQVPETCLKLDVGKRGGQPSTPQSEINRLLVDYCQQGKQVVRLKNGDPFIFGRAQAEIGALKRHDCEFEVVPGMSSALVAPLLAGIPLTDPQLSQSFTVVTAHNPDSLNWVALAKLDTLVFLMGGRTLPEIVRRLRGHGRSPNTPIAIIRYAGRSGQQIWEGTLNSILEQTAGISLSPCVIVVGEVVPLRRYVGVQGRRDRPTPAAAAVASQPPTRVEPSLPIAEISPNRPIPAEPVPALSPVESPLANKMVLVTRAVSQSSQFTNLLMSQGAQVIEMPTLEIGPPSSWRDLDRAIAHIDDFDWLILTSSNGVDYFFQRLAAVTGEPVLYSNIKIAVVGEKTAKRLAKLGIQPDFIPPNFVADALVAHFPEPPAGLRILFPRVESGGREVLVKELSSQGAKVREVAAYESRCPAAIAPSALRAIQTGAVDVVTFASSKTVQHFCQLLQAVDPDWMRWLEGVAIASIGPQTSQACEQLLGRVDVEAQEYTLDGLTQAIADWFAQASQSPTTSEVQLEPQLELQLESQVEDSPEAAIAELPEPSIDLPEPIDSVSPEESTMSTELTESSTPSEATSAELERTGLDASTLSPSPLESSESTLDLDLMTAIASATPPEIVETSSASASDNTESIMEQADLDQSSITVEEIIGENEGIAIAPTLEPLDSLTPDEIATDSESNWDDASDTPASDTSAPVTTEFDFPGDHSMTTAGNQAVDAEADATATEAITTDLADTVPFLGEAAPLGEIPVADAASSPPNPRARPSNPRVTANPNGRSRNQDSDHPVIEVELVADSEDIYPMETVYVELDSSREEESDWAP